MSNSFAFSSFLFFPNHLEFLKKIILFVMTEELNLCFRTPSTGRPRPVFLVLIPQPRGKVSLMTKDPMYVLQRGLYTHNPGTCVCSGPGSIGQECSLGFEARPIFLAGEGEPSQPSATMMNIKVRFNRSKAVSFVGLWGINWDPVTWGQ